MKVTIEDLKKNGFEVYSYKEIREQNVLEDEEILDEMDKLGADILLSNPSMARYWFFEEEESMLKYFKNGGKVSVDNHGQLVESLDEFDIEWEKRFSKTRNKVLSGEDGLEELRKMRDFVNRWETNV